LEEFVEYFKNLNELPENEKDQEIDFEILFNIFQSPFGSVLDFSIIIFAVLS
jgi:hypothetical protein